jgi:hypothetical protein
MIFWVKMFNLIDRIVSILSEVDDVYLAFAVDYALSERTTVGEPLCHPIAGGHGFAYVARLTTWLYIV